MCLLHCQNSLNMHCSASTIRRNALAGTSQCPRQLLLSQCTCSLLGRAPGLRRMQFSPNFNSGFSVLLQMHFLVRRQVRVLPLVNPVTQPGCVSRCQWQDRTVKRRKFDANFPLQVQHEYPHLSTNCLHWSQYKCCLNHDYSWWIRVDQLCHGELPVAPLSQAHHRIARNTLTCARKIECMRSSFQLQRDETQTLRTRLLLERASNCVELVLGRRRIRSTRLIQYNRFSTIPPSHCSGISFRRQFTKNQDKMTRG